MENLRKAFIMLGAAIMINAAAPDAVEAGGKKKVKKPNGKGKVQRGKKANKKKRVKRVKRARRRPTEFEPDLGMPAGTLYDVIGLGDLALK